MNIDDLICVGAIDNIMLSSTIGRNKRLINKDVLAQIINGTEELISELTDLCQQDLVSVNTIILDKLDSNVPLVQEVAKYLILSGGKRLRPL